MKINDKVPHGKIGHECYAGCEGYAEGGRISGHEQRMESRARNREELGLPPTESALNTIVDQVPVIGFANGVRRGLDLRERLTRPDILHNTVGRALETNVQRGGPHDEFGQGAELPMMSEGGMVEKDEKDPSIIPEDIKEFVKMAHKERHESRPDEGWRITPAEKPDAVDAPYKRDEEDAEKDTVAGYAKGGMIPGYADGGDFDVDGGDSDTVKLNGAMPQPAPVMPEDNPDLAPTDEGPGPDEPNALAAPAAPMVKPAAPAPAAPAMNDQDYMDRANKMLGLNPDQQAGFMRLLGDRSQKAQIGAGIAGIGDAIASGGTLGKVNPNGMGRSEELIRDKEKSGIEGMQTIRGNQEKTTELSQKLQAQDPNSPISKYAQKAYAGIGKKLGLDLSHASAAMISDVSGKGVEALNTEYQNQLKMMGLDLQKKQVEATIGNQKAERDIAREGHQAEAAKTLADRGVFKTLANAVPGTAGHNATKILERQAEGMTYTPDVMAYAQKYGISPEEAQANKDKRSGR